MQIKSILAGAAIALLAGLGAASAAEQFATLEGVSAETLSPAELARARGAHIIVHDYTTDEIYGGYQEFGKVKRGPHAEVTITDDSLTYVLGRHR